MTNKKNGTLYIGVTSDLLRRAYEHREGMIEGFTKKYKCKLLVWFEQFDRITDAIAREKQLKQFNRLWKVNLINHRNPDWRDLYEELA